MKKMGETIQKQLHRMDTNIHRLDTRMDRLEKRVDLCATKEDLNEFATREEMIEVFATKEDLKQFATRDEMLKMFATKEDMKQMITRREFVSFKDEILGAADNILKEFKTFKLELAALHHKGLRHEDRLDNHDHQIKTIQRRLRPA